MNKMIKFESFSRCLTWFIASLLVALAAGCGGGGGDQGVLGSSTVGSPALVSLEVTPATTSIPTSAPQQFVATATFADGSSRDVTASSSWTSGTTSVAKIDSTSGLATGVAVGPSVITANFGGMAASRTLTVNSETLVSIAVAPAADTVPIGLPQPIVATGTFSDGTTFDISNAVAWSSGADMVATVASSGVATGQSAGTVTITATSGATARSASINVSAATLVAIAVTPAVATVQGGLTQQHVATGTFSDGSSADISNSVTWSSGTIAVATVASPGVATGVSAGTATITATSGARAGSATLTVTAATLASIAVTPAAATVQIGLAHRFVATGTFSDGSSADISNSVRWRSGTTAVATVVSPGVATGHSAGTATITATSGGKSGSATLTVGAATTLQSIKVAPALATVQIGHTQRFVATGTFSNGTSADISNSVIWKSGTIAVATVVSPGVATGHSTGAATITASSGGKSGSATLTVTAALGPGPVLLGAAGNFAILTKAGITDVPSSAITGNIGTSPISGSAIGVTCPEVTGAVFSVDAAGPACKVTAPSLLTTAVANMQTAYTDAAGRPAGVGPFLNVGGGTVAGQTLVAGVYTWNTPVTITTDLTLSGGPTDVWIFQITGTLDMAVAKKVILIGGAQAKNIFWQVAGAVTLKPGSHFEGIILAQTNIAMQTGASINGRLLAQTAVSLQQNRVTQP
jgi:trimeric autotransporter adhesin